MKTPKKIGKAIAKKLKNWKGSPIATTAKGADMEELRATDMPAEVKDNLDVKEQTVDKATKTDTKLCEDSKDFQPIFESSEKAQNASIETTVQEPNASDILSSKSCFDSKSGKENTADEKEKPLMQQRQAILAGSTGIVLLVSSIVSYILKMYAIAVVGEIIGLACISFALYNILKPNTKLEKVEDIEQPNVQSFLNSI